MLVDLQVGISPDVENLLSSTKSAGLDGIVLTSDEARFPSTADLKENEEGVAVFSGAKVPTNHGLLLCLIPNPDEELGDDWAEMDGDVFDAISVISAIENLDGVVVALRPYDREVDLPMGDQIFGLHGISACDVQNGGLSANSNGLALEAASNLELPCVGLSSASDVESLGTAATLFRNTVETEAQLIEAIRHGECWPVSFSNEAPRVSESSNRGRRGGRSDGGRGGRGDGRRGARNGRRDGGRGGRGGRSDGGRGGRSDGGRGGRGGRSDGGRGGRSDGGRGGRSSGGGNRGGGGRNRRPRDGNRAEGGGGRQGAASEDYGNRANARGPNDRMIDENAGNRVTAAHGNDLHEDIGNRVDGNTGNTGNTGPGASHNDVDDNIGNR